MADQNSIIEKLDEVLAEMSGTQVIHSINEDVSSCKWWLEEIHKSLADIYLLLKQRLPPAPPEGNHRGG